MSKAYIFPRYSSRGPRQPQLKGDYSEQSIKIPRSNLLMNDKKDDYNNL